MGAEHLSETRLGVVTRYRTFCARSTVLCTAFLPSAPSADSLSASFLPTHHPKADRRIYTDLITFF